MEEFLTNQQIFEKMLQLERTEPRRLAYDKPSQLMLNFLWKYYNFSDFILQNNNFILFASYFSDGPKLDQVVEQRKRLGVDPTRIFGDNPNAGYIREENAKEKKLCSPLNRQNRRGQPLSAPKNVASSVSKHLSER